MTNIETKETINIEFKSDLKKLSDSDLIDVVVAFANTEGGELFLGVENNGEITGVNSEHQNYDTLPAFIANRTVPPVSVRVELLNLDKPVLKIMVPRSHSIVASTSGKILRRRLKADNTPENVPLYPYEMPYRLSSLSMLDYSAQPVASGCIDDLDPLERLRLRKILRTYDGEKTLINLEDDELDKALKLVTTIDGKLVPTYTGLLLIGKEESIQRLMPTVEASIQVMKGTTITVNSDYRLPILATFEKMDDFFKLINREEEVDVGLFRIPVPKYSLSAFREAIVNAFSHRDYTALGRIRLLLDDTGMTISNPGGFIEGLNYKNLIEAEPHGRNPLLADCLKRIGLAERSGRGIDRIYEGSLRYGKPMPDYSNSTERTVSLFIPNSMPDKAFIKMLAEETKNSGIDFSIYHLLVLGYLQHMHRGTFRNIKDYVNINETRLKSAIEALVELGMIEACGNGTNREYILSAKLYGSKHNIPAYIRQSNVDAERYPELIQKLIVSQGNVTRLSVVELLNITPSRAYRILKKMVQEGTLELVGTGRKAYYTICTNKKESE